VEPSERVTSSKSLLPPKPALPEKPRRATEEARPTATARPPRSSSLMWIGLILGTVLFLAVIALAFVLVIARSQANLAAERNETAKARTSAQGTLDAAERRAEDAEMKLQQRDLLAEQARIDADPARRRQIDAEADERQRRTSLELEVQSLKQALEQARAGAAVPPAANEAEIKRVKEELEVARNRIDDLKAQLAENMPFQRGDMPGGIEEDPGTLSNYAKHIGKSFLFRVTANRDAGSVYGSTFYTTDSTLQAVVVHAGVLRHGQTGVVRVTISEGRAKYTGSARNGVVSSAWDSYPGTYRVNLRE